MALVAGLTLTALVLVAALTDRRRMSSALVLGGLGALWLVVNKGMEGMVLWQVAPNSGLTAGDLAGLAAIGVAAWRVWTLLRRGRR